MSLCGETSLGKKITKCSKCEIVIGMRTAKKRSLET